ncbi:MAG TPA: hypothetical protein VFD36_29380 [Kofleriaceae bacterium]|nr:hypothetical protein [Kofleriaceae bacterium]
MAHHVPFVTRDAVLGAIAHCDALGIDEFLARYGYGPSRRFVLRHGGRSYPSKAIVGFAAGLHARQFSGGAGHACRVLAGLGFTVRRGAPRGLDAEIASVARSLDFDPQHFSPPVVLDLPVEPVAYFASGSNHEGEIEALADLGHDVGVSARELGPSGEAALGKLAGTDIQVFVDSGAFAEVTFETDGPRVVSPMTPVKWRRVIGLYRRLAAVLADQLHVVAPDRVGCQETTLARLADYAEDMRELHAQGVRVLVPVQKGALSQAAFYRRACEILGFEAIPSLPCMKAATTPEEAAAFAREIQPRQLHLLGVGRSERAQKLVAAVVEASPDTHVQLDAVLIKSLVNRTGGRGGRPRVLTAANDLAIQLARTVSCLATVAARKYLGLVLALGGVGAMQ